MVLSDLLIADRIELDNQSFFVSVGIGRQHRIKMSGVLSQNAGVLPTSMRQQSFSDVSFADVDPSPTSNKEAVAPQLVQGQGFDAGLFEGGRGLRGKWHGFLSFQQRYIVVRACNEARGIETRISDALA